MASVLRGALSVVHLAVWPADICIGRLFQPGRIGRREGVAMDIFNIASSGLSAATARLNVAASNIVNSDPRAAGQDAVGDVSSNTDLITQSVNLTIAKEMYDANAATIRVGQQVTGTLLDILDTDGAQTR
jgi:flagellar basal body rod protein FlgC